ncbi:hypothetical protein KTO58_07020 [Chitinophaga pendula]|uniref:hypothetical protein n=1 Tax=Chitinophaga TaxID=79328 RepID=UPI000BB09A52|nr:MULTISPECIES: hypothetical protein [Chitinophaga]ASZ13444.1 hypothetical protein CK934_22030 [Chitinophaga sp. MD30]UCJ08930.1 hypothetical protein KTO58_07020 [Chitinophaga pendula]
MKRIKRSLLAISAIFGVGSAIAGSAQSGDRYVKTDEGKYQLINSTVYLQGTCAQGGTMCSYAISTSAPVNLPKLVNSKSELNTLMLQNPGKIIPSPGGNGVNYQLFVIQ